MTFQTWKIHFPDLENSFLKFHDFPGCMGTLLTPVMCQLTVKIKPIVTFSSS